MKIQKGLIDHDPDSGRIGDCFRTCVACVLGMEAKDVPHFYGDILPKDFTEKDALKVYNNLKKWLWGQGYSIVNTSMPGDFSYERVMEEIANWTEMPVILTGSSGGGSNHSVVVYRGGVICDPSYDGPNLVGPHDGGVWGAEILVKPIEDYLSI